MASRSRASQHRDAWRKPRHAADLLTSCVRCISSAPGGQQWWIEPASRPITSPAAMDARQPRGDLDPCIKLVYDDDLFFSCLVSMGCAGVLYAVVVETVQAYRLSTTSLPPLPWPIVSSMMQSMLVAPRGSVAVVRGDHRRTRRAWHG